MRTQIVGVVSEHAPAYALSFDQHRLLDHPVTTEIADGMACRTPEPEALDHLWFGCTRVVRVTDGEVEDAMRLMFTATHNVAEGAGAAPLAAAMKERHLIAGQKVALVLSGGNVDRDVFARVLAGT